MRHNWRNRIDGFSTVALLACCLALACSSSQTGSAGSTVGAGGAIAGSGGSQGSAVGGSGGDGGATDIFCEQLAEQLQSTLETSIEAAKAPGGAVAAMMTAECGIWEGAAGEAGAGTPLLPNNLVRIGSVTKTYTAAAILALIEAGTLSLDDTLAGWVPAIPNSSTITLRQLLNHTSGVFSLSDDKVFMGKALADPSASYTPQQLVDAIASHPPAFSPGTDWGYSNSNYLLLGIIIEAAAGTTVSSYIRSAFLEPLSLKQTFLDGEESLPSPLARAYGPNGIDHTVAVPPSVTWTSGAMVATISDVTQWGHALFNGNALSVQSRALMQTFIDTGSPGVEYGLGAYRLTSVTPQRIGHPGSIPGYQTMMFFLPDSKAVLSVVVNSRDGAPQPHFNALYQAYLSSRKRIDR